MTVPTPVFSPTISTPKDSRGAFLWSLPVRQPARQLVRRGPNVSFEDGVLSVHAKVPQRSLPGRQLVQEYGIGDYRRSFRLGEGFDASQISAEYRKGVLTIHVPRLAAVRPRKIEVRPA